LTKRLLRPAFSDYAHFSFLTFFCDVPALCTTVLPVRPYGGALEARDSDCTYRNISVA
jgi:hypothetical protein